MSFIAKRAALQATRAVRQPTLRRTYADALSSAEQAEKKNVLAKGARRDPELYVRTRPFPTNPLNISAKGTKLTLMPLFPDSPNNHDRRFRPRRLAFFAQPNILLLREPCGPS